MLSHLVRALGYQFQRRLLSPYLSRSRLPFGLAFTGKKSLRPSTPGLCPRVLFLLGRLAHCVRRNSVWCLRRKKLNPLWREIPAACFVLSCRATRTALGLHKTSFGWLRKTFEQESGLQGRHTVPKPEHGGATELKDEEEVPVLFGDPPPIK